MSLSAFVKKIKDIFIYQWIMLHRLMYLPLWLI